MARTDKQELTHAAGIIREWDPAGTVVELEHTFFILNDIDRGSYADQWQLVRDALNENSDLSNAAIRANLSRKNLARQGYWWWNPSEW